MCLIFTTIVEEVNEQVRYCFLFICQNGLRFTPLDLVLCPDQTIGITFSSLGGAELLLLLILVLLYTYIGMIRYVLDLHNNCLRVQCTHALDIAILFICRKGLTCTPLDLVQTKPGKTLTILCGKLLLLILLLYTYTCRNDPICV